MISLRKSGLALAAGLGMTLAHPAAAQVIYSDNFSMGSAGSLNGQKPSTDPSSAVYTVLSSDAFSGSASGASDIKKSGAGGPAAFVFDTPTGTSNSPGLVNAFLPYSMAANGPTVTISATFVMPNDATWFALGFGQDVASSQFGATTGTGPWMLVRGTGSIRCSPVPA